MLLAISDGKQRQETHTHIHAHDVLMNSSHTYLFILPVWQLKTKYVPCSVAPMDKASGKAERNYTRGNKDENMTKRKWNSGLKH